MESKIVAEAGGNSGKIVFAFITRFEELLQALTEVFTECQKTQKALQDFQTLVKPFPHMHEVIVRKWHQDIEMHYETIRKRDATVLLSADISLFNKLDMKTKWADPTFDQDSRTVLFDYLDQLNGYAAISQSVPGNMMKKIESTAMGLVEQLQSGQFQPDSFSLEKMTKSLLGDMSQEDLDEFAQNIPKLQGTIQNVITNNMSQLGGMNNMNLSSLLGSMMAGMQK